ncbi:MAG: tRNA-dihydrouridine synthase [Candidatus Methanomethyliaceae archaeon]|nr:tRNA-dihydrouridine synthase [Candidatus Methanomethyliaceae archaeon]
MRFELPKDRLVIPSGIVVSSPDIIKRLEDADGLGVITTKSIGLSERDGYKEPIMAGIYGSLINAVGLSNPGIDAHINEIRNFYPFKKVLMTSIFGSTPEEFASLASRVERYTDWIELNLSCPHAKGYGAAIGTSPSIVREVVSSVREVTDLPIFAKLVPSPGSIGLIAKIAVDSGADGITAVNTVGPLKFIDERTGTPILSNIYGGLSGIAIKEIALKCIMEVRESVSVPIIGMGGITESSDIAAFNSAGATLFGIGTALTGMSTQELMTFFKEFTSGTKKSKHIRVPLSYKEFHVEEAWGSSSRVLVLDGSIDAVPGQFVFLWLPGIGEKPFSLALNDPITLLIKKKGPVSSSLASLEEGDTILLRGPYGNGYIPKGNVNLVGGGSGVAPIYFIAKLFREQVTSIFIGGKSASDLPLYEGLREVADVKVSTEDGSLGTRSMVTDILDLTSLNCEFFNCGPEHMLVMAAEMESRVTNPDKIFCALERYTKCGVGICGSCAMDGLRVCVDGPVFQYSVLKEGTDFGRCKRRPSGRRVSINEC